MKKSCWCDEVDQYECWQCRDERIELELIESGKFRELALLRGVDDFKDYSRIMSELHKE